MSQQFVDRDSELAFLEQAYRSRKAELLVIYGRRRVGKSALVLEFLKRRPGIYFLASTEGDRENIANFRMQLAGFLGKEPFPNVEFTDWFSLFDALCKNSEFISALRRKLVITLDEFPFLIHSNPSIPSIFQRIWELALKDKNVLLILSGSSVSVMEERVLGPTSPLYGRRTGQWELQPLGFASLKRFLPYSVEDLAKVWFVVGGVPEYLLKFDPALDAWSNIQGMLTRGSYLYREADILLKEEFREPKNYVLIFKAIALGHTTSGEICNYTGLDKGMVSKYLETLTNMGIVREEVPVTASAKFKRRMYLLADPYFAFWFRYVYPNKIDLEAGRAQNVLARVKRDFPAYAGVMFEQLIEHLVRQRALLKEHTFSKVGRWWHKEEEIDLVCLGDREILFAECKWQDKADAARVLAELKRKAALVDWPGSRHYAIFAKSFANKPQGAILIDLKGIAATIK